MMQSGSKNNWQETWVFGLLVFLLMGLLVSRAVVSFASVLLVIPFFFTARKTKPAHFLSFVLFLLPVLVSGLWSDDHSLWWNSVSVKLPFLTMMLGLTCVHFSPVKFKQLTWIFLLVVTTGCCWSLSQYSVVLQEAYLKAKTLPTPMDDDHIRFSWLVAVAVALGVHAFVSEKNKRIKTAILVVLVFLTTYLHILAAKTGLVCLYGGCVLYLLYTGILQKKWKTAIGILMAVFLMAALCYKTMPTLRNRIQYVWYDFGNYSKGNSMPGYNDAARWLSIRVGYAIMNAHPLKGVGAGDVLAEVNKWHDENHPQSLAYERFLPANEWLVYGAVAGWPGFLFFSAALILLLYTTTSKNALSFALSLTTCLPFLIDDTFEGQYGVVILAFIAFFGQQKLTTRNL